MTTAKKTAQKLTIAEATRILREKYPKFVVLYVQRDWFNCVSSRSKTAFLLAHGVTHTDALKGAAAAIIRAEES